MPISNAVAIRASAVWSPLTDLEGARNSLHAKIYTHILAIAALRERLNTLTLIGRFPPEVLGEVFVHYAAAMHKENTRNGSTRGDILPICLVSRYWRATAMGTPRIWRRICKMSPEGTLEWLRRSKMTPLVYYDKYYDTMTETRGLVEVGKNFHRMADFTLRAHPCDLKALCAGMAQSAPLLERLRIVAKGGDSDEESGKTIIFPASVTTPAQSRLCEVNLSGVLMKWSNPLLASSLNTLCLRGSVTTATASGTFAQFLDALQRMRALEVAFLENVIPPPPSTTSESQLICLPRLRELILVSETETAGQLFAHLSPSTTLTKISVTLHSEAETDNTEAFAQAVARTLSAWPPLPHMRIESDGDDLSIVTVQRGADLPKSKDDACFRLVMHPSPGLATIAASLAPVCQTKTLHVDSEEAYPWDTILRSVPAITTLVTYGAHGPLFRRALTHLKDASVLPALEEVDLVSFTFMKRNDRTRSYQRLLEWLRARRRCRSSISLLRVGDPRNIDQEVVNRLEKAVDFVELYGVQVTVTSPWEGESD